MPPPGSPALAAVLAGGRGSRLGAPKATARLAGRPLIAYPLAAARGAGLETVVVAKPASALPPLDVAVWREPDQPAHPLCGIVHALRVAGGRVVVAVGCDMPFVTPELLAELAGTDAPALVPSTRGRLHPLVAAYAPESRDLLAAALARGAPLSRAVTELGAQLLDEARLRPFGDPDRLLLNVNTPADLARADAALTGAPAGVPGSGKPRSGGHDGDHRQADGSGQEGGRRPAGR